MPTLYDNFERVRQYIDQHQADVDLSSYVSKDELSGCGYLTAVPSDYPTYAAISEMGYVSGADVSAMGYVTSGDVAQMGYVTNEVTQLDGPLFISYQTVNNTQYTLNAYSHIIAGTEDKTGVSLVATKRKCGGAEGTSYMASFFTNSDGRSKFAHKSKISATEVGGQSDDAFMCFNAYGFRIAYSGEQGVAASTEYEILHEGNIGNLGYVSGAEISAMGYITAADIPVVDLSSYVTYDFLSAQGYVSSVPVIDENIIPKENGTYTLGDSNTFYAATYTKAAYLSSSNVLYNQSSNQVNLDIGSRRFVFTSSFFPSANTNLGKSDRYWNIGYVSYIFTNTAYLQDTSYTKSIVPAENNSYTLGDASHMYSNTYSYNLWVNSYAQNGFKHNSNESFFVSVANTNKFVFATNAFYPYQNNRKLGLDNHYWGSAYISDIYTNTAYLQDTSYTKSIVPAENESYTLGDNSYYYKSTYSSNLVMNTYESGFYIAAGQYGGIKIRIATLDRFNIGSGAIYPLRTGSTIGTTANPFAYTYTQNLILNGTDIEDRFNNFIWTGTSAEYAALDNYTSYQIYMIKEA